MCSYLNKWSLGYRPAQICIAFTAIFLFIAPAWAQAAQLLWSQSSNRSSAETLDGAALARQAYIFVTEEAGITSIRFYLNTPTSGTPFHTEGVAPYDFAGTVKSSSLAMPYNSNILPDGAHTIEAVVVYSSGATQTLTANFEVANATSTSPSAEIFYSLSPNRGTPLALNGATVSGGMYAFVYPENNINSVEFYIGALDNTPDKIEGMAPYDLQGGTVASANIFDTATLSDGNHILYAVLHGPSGTEIIQSNFNVANATTSLEIGSSSVYFTQVVGGSAPAAQSVSVSLSNGAAVGFSIAESASWLTAVGAGNTPGSVNFAVDSAGLIPGTYTAQVLVSSSGLPSKQISVTYQLTPPSSYPLQVSANADRTAAIPLHQAVLQDPSYVFVAPEGQVSKVEFYLNVLDQTPDKIEALGPYDFAGTQKNAALTALPWDLSNAVLGTNTMYAKIYWNNAPTEFVSAVFEVTESIDPNAAFTASPPAIAEQLAVGGTIDTLLFLGLNAQGDGSSPAYSISDNQPWISVSPPSGNAPDALVVTLNASGLPAGQHTGQITVSSAVLPSINIPVTLSVINLNTPSLMLDVPVLQVTAGVDQTLSRTVAVNTSNASNTIFIASENASWLSSDSENGTAPGNFNLILNTNGLADGNYSTTITFSAPGYNSAFATVNLTVANNNPCAPVICNQIKVNLPYELTFEVDSGHLLSGNGVGTGFTYISPTDTDSGYIPQNMSVNLQNGTFSLTTTSGIQFLNANSNANAVGVGFAGPNQITQISTTLLNPASVPTTSNYEQAGLWFGVDQDNYVKLVYLADAGNKISIQFLAEVDGQKTFSQTIPVVNFGNAANANYRFEITVDPFKQMVTGRYAVNEGSLSVVGSYAAPAEFYSFDAAGIDPEIGTRSFAGVFATHRNRTTPLQFTFDDFNVRQGETPSVSTEIAWNRKSHPVQLPSSMVWGPDGRLYVAELFGTIHALTYDANLNVVNDQVISSLVSAMGPRMTLGITLDPESTPDNVIIWMSHSSPSVNAGVINSGVVSRLSGTNFATVEHRITGLPRALANHATNSLHFGPDGRLYLSVGGNTGAGSPVSVPTEFGDREEQPLSAAIVVADVNAADFDGACYSDGQDPIFGDPGCDVYTYATGLRNSYDFIFHSNGQMYATDNGLGVTGAYPPSPEPSCVGLSNPALWLNGGNNPGEQPDLLYRVTEGAYYGHPNPSRNECVFKNGLFQGVPPLPDYQPPITELGTHTSSNGIIEYKGNGACGTLNGKLLIANYSAGDNILGVELSPNGEEVIGKTTIVGGFNDPLTLSQNAMGDLFVAEFGAGHITALRTTDASCWELRANMPATILDAASAGIGSKLYSVAGKQSTGHVNLTYIYDTLTDTWTSGASKPGPAVENAAAAAVDGMLYFFGGSTDPFTGVVNNGYRYDPATNVWTPTANMPTARGGVRAEVVDGLIYVIGGMDNNSGSLDVVEVYNPATNTWSTATPMSQARDNPGSAVINGKIYAIGGRHKLADGTEINAVLNSVEVYDPATDTWSFVAPMPTGRRTMVTGFINGKLYVIGGEKNESSPTGLFKVTERYDPATNTWEQLSDPPTPRHGAAYATINGRIYVAGGGIASGSSFSAITEVY